MFLIYLILSLATTYLIVITPELYIQLGYIIVFAYACFQMGMQVQATYSQIQLNNFYVKLRKEFEQELREENKNDRI